MNRLIYNANRAKTRLHPFLLCFLFLLYFIVAQLVLLSGIGIVFVSVFRQSIQSGALSQEMLSLLDNVFSFVVMLGVSVLWVKAIERRPALGLPFSTIVKQYLGGAAGGAVAVAIPCLLAIAFTNTANLLQTLSLTPETLLSVFIYLVFFAMQGAAEEVMCRWALMVPLSRKAGVLPAAAITSLLFSALHLANPGMSFVPFFNIFLAGLVFGLMMFYHESPWPAFAAHSFWNFVMGNVLGISVSGGSFGKSILNPVLSGPQLISGGGFGAEGTIFTTILGVGLTAAYLVLYKRKFGTFSAKASALPVAAPIAASAEPAPAQPAAPEGPSVLPPR